MRILGVFASVVLAACGSSHSSEPEPDAEGPVDGGPVDAVAPARDGWTPVADGGPDAAAVDIDVDGDGVPQALDCDDGDPAVGRTASRVCARDCTSGLERCTDGVWAACDAPAGDCTCTTPGEARVVPCGMCGSASQTCGEDRRWSAPGTCLYEGECTAATVETDAARCGERVRLCSASCEWLPWEERTPPGECEPGEADYVSIGCESGRTRPRTCSAACAWEPAGDCAIRCLTAPRASRTGADPVCIPAGPFVWGDNSVYGARPPHTIYLSEFHVDRVPVTRARYELCRVAGACPDPARSEEYAAADSGDYAPGVDHSGAVAFCTWDGGALVDAFQWEKAARGPAPDARLNAWGDNHGDCGHHPWVGCPDKPFPVTSFPMSVSPWGVRLLGSLFEVTDTNALYGYYADPDLTDPPGPPPDSMGRMTVKGWPWMTTGTVTASSAVTWRALWGYWEGFRCVY